MDSTIIPESDRKLVAHAVERLLEHFDSVRIFVTRHDGDKDTTVGYSRGGGNFYAQRGQITEWTNQQQQIESSPQVDENEDE
jgi:hypothetical protein